MTRLEFMGGCAAIASTGMMPSPAAGTPQEIENKRAAGGAAARTVKPVNGLCNTIRFSGNANGELYNRYLKWYKALEIPETRFHDVAIENPGVELVDVSRIFPLFHLDESDPRNYNFAPTDVYLAKAREVGGELEFRFGEQIEHQTAKFQIRPPADAGKWARICLNIARHYNSGWADGFRWNIRRFSVWEEPDNDRLLDGSTKGAFESKYFAMYASLARMLKSEWPSAHVGGPNTMGPGEKFVKFVKHCAAEKLPLDFAAYTFYTRDPQTFAQTIRKARTILDDAGFGKAELEVSEWHCAPSTWNFAAPGYVESLTGPYSFAFVGAVLTVAQDAPVDRMFYYAAHVSDWSLFINHRPRPVYYVMRTFAELVRAGNRLEIPANPRRGVYTLAAAPAGGDGVMTVSVLDAKDGALDLSLPAGFGVKEIRRVADADEPAPVGGWSVAGGRLRITVPKGSSFHRVTLQRLQAGQAIPSRKP